MDASTLWREIVNTSLSLFGEVFADPMLKLEYFDGGRGVLRCSREELDKAIIVLSLLNEVGGGRVAAMTLGVSGTIKSCMRKFVR